MTDAHTASEPTLVPIPEAEASELIALGLTVSRGSALRASLAREAFAVIADRLTDYFRQSGIVLMRPPPRKAHSSNDLGMNGPSAPRER